MKNLMDMTSFDGKNFDEVLKMFLLGTRVLNFEGKQIGVIPMNYKDVYIDVDLYNLICEAIYEVTDLDYVVGCDGIYYCIQPYDDTIEELFDNIDPYHQYDSILKSGHPLIE